MKDRDILETSYCLDHEKFSYQDKITRFGEKGDTFYIIIYGAVSVWVPLPKDKNMVISAYFYGSLRSTEDVGF